MLQTEKGKGFENILCNMHFNPNDFKTFNSGSNNDNFQICF